MHDFELYRQQLFTFNNPIFFAMFLSFIIIALLLILYIKVLYPLQKKMFEDKQKHLLEKAELMALFAELDPDPLLRINSNGEIIQSNEASRKLFSNNFNDIVNIRDIIPDLQFDLISPQTEKVLEINNKYFTVDIQHQSKLEFINIYLHDITDLKNYETELETYKRNLVSLSTALDKQIEELKKDLSSELHDDICQRMILAKLKLSQGNKFPLEQVEKDLEEITEQVRKISHDLVPVNVNAFGIRFSLQNLVSRITEGSGIKGLLDISEEIDEVEDEIPSAVKNVLVRSVQEALTNIVKHSRANEFSVMLYETDCKLELKISDNGIGIPNKIDDMVLKNNSGIGLFRLRERIRDVGGSFIILSDEKYKTNLVITIPVEIWTETDETIDSIA